MYKSLQPDEYQKLGFAHLSGTRFHFSPKRVHQGHRLQLGKSRSSHGVKCLVWPPLMCVCVCVCVRAKIGIWIPPQSLAVSLGVPLTSMCQIGIWLPKWVVILWFPFKQHKGYRQKRHTHFLAETNFHPCSVEQRSSSSNSQPHLLFPGRPWARVDFASPSDSS